ncbi:MAG: hypothetical protein V4710_00875 [Verrucomicrobiota bacterium]
MKKSLHFVSFHCLATGLFLTATGFAVQNGMPEAKPGDRYAKMIERSPFAVATVVAPVVPEAADFGQNMYITGVDRWRMEDGSEKYRVHIKTQGDLRSNFSLLGNEPNKDGYSIATVEWADNAKNTKVTIKKGTEFSILKFDQQSTPSVPNANNVPPNPNQPRLPVPMNNTSNFQGRGIPQGMVPRSGPRTIQSPIPRPNMIPPPQPQGAINPGMAPGAEGAPESRRRVRQITLKP